jgi:large subunit ribosomal protein L5
MAKKETKKDGQQEAKQAAEKVTKKDAKQTEKQEAGKEAKKDAKQAVKQEAGKEVKKDAKQAEKQETKKEAKKDVKQEAKPEVKKEEKKEPKSDYKPRLIDVYRKDVVPYMQKKFSYRNIMQVPRLEKIVLNIGVGEATENAKNLDSAVEELTKVTGQKPVIRRAKKAISNFKLRAGMPIGCSVTLRKWHMFEFLERLITIAIPRVRDFRGLPIKFDGRGNYNMAIKEQIVFPEIDYDKVEKVRGFNITFVTTAKTDEEAYELLSAFGMPFVKRN